VQRVSKWGRQDGMMDIDIVYLVIRIKYISVLYLFSGMKTLNTNLSTIDVTEFRGVNGTISGFLFTSLG
jgi:hypothetical protein